jgi:hypothetical protein
MIPINFQGFFFPVSGTTRPPKTNLLLSRQETWEIPGFDNACTGCNDWRAGKQPWAMNPAGNEPHGSNPGSSRRYHPIRRPRRNILAWKKKILS